MPIKPYIPWIAAALGIFLVALALPHRDDEGTSLPGQARGRDRIRRTVKTFSQLVDEKDPHPLADVNRQGLPIDIELDPGTFELMLLLHNRGTFKERSLDVVVRFADRSPRPATLSLRGGSSLNMPAKPNFDIKLLTAEEFAPGIKLKRFYLMNLRADPHHLKMMTGYRLLAEHDLLATHFQFATVTVNGNPMGVFFLVEPPVSAIQRANKDCVAVHRRFRPNRFTHDWTKAVPSVNASLNDLHSLSYRGQLDRPVEELSEVVSLNDLFTWLSVNSAILNSDSTDELFLYEVRKDLSAVEPLRLMAWDYDDIFALKIRRDTVADPLMFSFNGYLELLVHRHPQLYDRYRNRLRELLGTTLHHDHLRATLRGVAKIRDSLDDGLDPAVQAAERQARAAYVAQIEELLTRRHAELLEALGPAPR